VQIQFTAATDGNRYRAGDYWLIPARTATGDVVWPRDANGAVARPPAGVEHHYAPLAIAWVDDADGPQAASCRCEIKQSCPG
jgi:hypothetical protein